MPRKAKSSPSSASPAKTRSKSKKSASPKVKANQVVFSNGAIAEKGKNPKNPNLLTIVKGPTKGNSGPRGVKSLSPSGAARAFNKFYSTTNRYKSPKSRQAAITRDLCHSKSGEKTVRTSKYASIKGRRTGPLTFDYPGIDDGSMCPTGAPHGSKSGSKAMKDKMKALRARKMSGGGVKSMSPANEDFTVGMDASPSDMSDMGDMTPGDMGDMTPGDMGDMDMGDMDMGMTPADQAGGRPKTNKVTPLEQARRRKEVENTCYFNNTTKRCAKGPFAGMGNPKWCEESDKGICKKTELGSRRAPKRKPLVLKPNLDLTGSLQGAVLCKDMNEKDCKKAGKLMGCEYGPMGRKGKDGTQVVGCHQKHVATHVGKKEAVHKRSRGRPAQKKE